MITLSLLKRANFILPVGYLIIAMLFIILNVDVDANRILTLRFIANYIFLNTIHVAFTYVMLSALGEINIWWRREYRARRSKLKLIFILAAAGLSGALLMGEYLNQNSYIVILLYVLFLFFPAQHSLMQHYGLLMANLCKERHCEPAVTMPGSRLQVSLKTVFKALNILNFSYILILHLKTKHIIGHENYEVVRNILVLVFIGFVGLIARALIEYDNNRRNNLIFLTRLLLYPAGYINPIAFVLIAATHGFEYLVTVINMVQRSKLSNGVFLKKSSWAIIIIVFILGLADRNGGLVGMMGLRINESIFLSMLWAMHISVTYLHYYLDREIFSFGNKLNKQNHVHLMR